VAISDDTVYPEDVTPAVVGLVRPVNVQVVAVDAATPATGVVKINLLVPELRVKAVQDTAVTVPMVMVVGRVIVTTSADTKATELV